MKTYFKDNNYIMFLDLHYFGAMRHDSGDITVDWKGFLKDPWYGAPGLEECPAFVRKAFKIPFTHPGPVPPNRDADEPAFFRRRSVVAKFLGFKGTV